MSTEYERTCNKCGASWYVSADQAKERRPTKKDNSRAALLSIATLGASAGQLAANEAKAARVDAISRCPHCSSTQFTQVKDDKLNRELKAAAVAVEQYRSAGSPDMTPSPNALPPGCQSAELLVFAQAAQTVARRAGSRLGFMAATNVARNVLWYQHLNTGANAESGARQLGERLDADNRVCPMCAEVIRVEARKCRHCGSEVEPLA